MTKVVKALAASGLFAMIAIALVGLPMGAKMVDAQSPPAPPSAFYGNVTLDGELVGNNVLVEAVVDGTVCGSDYTDGSSVYSLYVESMQPSAPSCGVAGDTVLFYIGGVATGQLGGSGVWNNSIAQQVNLSYTTPTTVPTETSTATATVTTTPDDDDDDDDDDNGAATATPKAPTTGTGAAGTGSDASSMLFAALGLGAVALGAGGVAVARRSR